MSVAFTHSVLADNIVRERVYVQTDKQTYLAGELLWMKFYLTDESGKPTTFSKIGYVELTGESDVHVQIKLDITDGLGEGWMELPVSLSTGNYILTAYTRNMRNEGEPVFFSKTIGIINTFKSDASVKTDTVSDVYISHDLEKNNISVVTGMSVYKTRSLSEIQIHELPENIHSLSISVAGKDFVTSKDNILKWHNRLPALSDVHLDNYFLPEYEGHIISGKVVDAITNQPAEENSSYSYLGFTGNQMRVFGGFSDGENNIQFVTDLISGTKEMAVATVSLSSSEYRVNIQSPFALHSEKKIQALKLNPEWKNQLLQRSVGLQVLYAYFVDSMSRVDTTYAHFQWKPDRTYILDEYTRFTTIEEIVIEFIPSLRFRRFDNKRFLTVLADDNSAFSLGSSLVVFDGIPIIDHDIIYKYDPLLIYKIEVYKEKFVFGNKRFDGMVLITTYNHDYPGLVLDEKTQIFDYEGTQVHRYFYSPSYVENTSTDSNIPDYRHTLLWMPEVEHNGQNSLTVPFSTSDLTGDYQVTVEGFTKDGKIIRGTSFFKVEKP